MVKSIASLRDYCELTELANVWGKKVSTQSDEFLLKMTHLLSPVAEKIGRMP